MSLLRLFNDYDGKRFVVHEKSMDLWQPGNFFSGENPPTQFMGLQRNSGGSAGRDPWDIISPASYNLKVGLFKASDGAQLAFQGAWTDDLALGVKYGTLVYDSAAIATALATSPTGLSCFLESDVSIAGNPYKTQALITLKKGWITPALASVPAGEVSATQKWAMQTFLPRDGTNADNPCEGFYILLQGGAKAFVYWDANKTMQVTDA